MYRVLYVDDEPELLELGRIFLENSGDFSVGTETSALAALDILGSARYDAVVSDYQMPEMDGITFLVCVREKYGDLPFILFTGRGREEVVIQAINNGADFYLQKGGDPTAQFAELAHKIRQAVIRRNAQYELRAAYEQITASEEELRSQLDDIVEAQKERNQTELNFRNLVDNAPDAIFIETQDRFRYLNSAALRLLGATAEGDLLGTPTFDRIHPSFHENIRQRVIDLTVAFRPVKLQHEIYVRLDGSLVDVEVAAMPFLYQSEHGAVVLVRDITERVKAENDLRQAYEKLSAAEEELRSQYDDLAKSEHRLRESEESYRGLFNTVRQAIYVQDREWKFIDVNDGAVDMYGYSREEFIGRTPEFLSVPGKNDLDAVGRYMKRAFDGEPQQFVFWAKAKDGRIFPKDVRVYRGTYFGRPVLIAIGTDITRSIQAEEELRAAYEQISAAEEALRGQYEEIARTKADLQQRNQMLEEIAITIPGVIYQFYVRPGTPWGFYYISRRATEVFGISDEREGFFDRFTRQVDPRDREAFLFSVQEAVTSGSSWDFQGRFIRPSGETIRFRGMSRPIRKEQELVYSGVLLDITPRCGDT